MSIPEKMLDWLLKKTVPKWVGIDVNTQEDVGLTPLHLAYLSTWILDPSGLGCVYLDE